MISISKILQKQKEVLGINRRNQEYIRPLNPLSAKRIADNKLLTKRVLTKAGIATPTLFKVIRTRQQLHNLDWSTFPKSFVVKPNRGTQGEGILILYGKRKNEYTWIKANGQRVTQRDLILFMEQILDGRFSMGNRPDIVLIEERVKNHPLLKRYAYKGVPDIRIIVYNNVPIMAMTRIPTKESNGKANLHAGAICAGIDIAQGVTTTGIHLVSKSILENTYEPVEETYDLKENLPISGIQIPFWDEILSIAIRCQQVSNLGYMGADIALDRDRGPLVFELNARPGLGIQMANNAGLRYRLERVKGLKIKSVKHGVRVAKSLFGGEIEEEVETITGKHLLNLREKIRVYYLPRQSKKRRKEKSEIVKAFLDTGNRTSRISPILLSRIGFSKIVKELKSRKIKTVFADMDEAKSYLDKNEKELFFDESIKRYIRVQETGQVVIRPVFEIKVKIDDEVKNIDVAMSEEDTKIYPLVIGRGDMGSAIVDVG